MPGDSLFIGVSGLNAYQDQIDVISNNIANVNTTGFKAQRVTFQDLLYQTQQFTSAPTSTNGGVNAVQNGLGVKVATTDTDFTQGGMETTGINTDLAISGDGFFILGDAGTGDNPVYTRDGAFSLNQNGMLYDPATGKAVLGYQADSAGDVTVTATPGTIQIPLGLKSQAVGTGFGTKIGPTGDQVYDMSFGGNLDSATYISAATANAVATTVTTSTTIYDSLGDAHLVDVTFTPVTSGNGGESLSSGVTVENASGTLVTAATEWQYTITPTDGTVLSADTGYIFFDQNGQFINTSGSGTATTSTIHTADSSPSVTAGDQIEVTSWGPAGQNNSTALSATPGPIGIDFSGLTSLSGTSSANIVAQNGFSMGTLQNITIGEDGTITGAFSNGQSQTLGQLAMATFQNEQGLLRVGNSDYQASANSGLAQIGVANSGRLGAIISGDLEESNVSMANEFTLMIAAQRAFEANSASITTADQDLQTVIQLKR